MLSHVKHALVFGILFACSCLQKPFCALQLLITNVDGFKACKSCGGVSHGLFCKSCALFWAREGRYSNAIQSLSPQGVAGHDDDSALDDLLHWHSSSTCPDEDVLPSNSALTVDSSMVLYCINTLQCAST